MKTKFFYWVAVPFSKDFSKSSIDHYTIRAESPLLLAQKMRECGAILSSEGKNQWTKKIDNELIVYKLGKVKFPVSVLLEQMGDSNYMIELEKNYIEMMLF